MSGVLCLISDQLRSAIGERLFLFGDHGEFLGTFCIELDVALPFIWNIVFVVNRLDGAFWNTGLAINALIGMDVHHGFPFVETLHGADHDAVGVFAFVARFANDMRH